MLRISSVCAPSASLAPLSKLSALSPDQVCQSLANLRRIYGPQPAATLPPKLTFPTRKHLQRIHDDSVPDSGYASAEDDEELEEFSVITDEYSSDDDGLDVLRADPMERAFTIRWLTGFIARSDTWSVDAGSDDGEAEDDERTQAVNDATNLLGVLLNDNQEEEQDCSVTRSFKFATHGGRSTIQVELNDAPLSDDDHTSVGLQSWASSIVLSERICADPQRFSLSGDGKPLRILELGAGTGLLSIVAAKLLSSSSSSSPITSSAPLVFATDYHPDVLVNLRANIVANFHLSNSRSGGHPISVHQLDWEHPDFSCPFDQPFDLIVGADVVYYPDHAKWIKACVERLLSRPSAQAEFVQAGTNVGVSSAPDSGSARSGGVFWLMIALRMGGRHEGMFRTVEDIFPDVSSSALPSREAGGGGRVWRLAILERVEIEKMKGVGRADERGYLLFKIGWVPG